MQTRTWIDCTLGELIRAAREEKGMSRTKLAEFTEISPNTMVRYELAGTPNGKYPQVKRLIKICDVLEIDPRNAFDAINMEKSERQQDLSDLSDLPPAPPLEEILKPKFIDRFRDLEQWKNVPSLLQKMIDVEKLDDQLNDIVNRLSRIETAIENGPDHDDPSRPDKTKNNPEAVDAASTNPPKKGKTDEVV